MSDIRHSCKCLGRKFTTDEWHEYLYQHPHALLEPVFQFKGYEYNVYDICLNPHIPVKIELGGCKVSIMTAEMPSGLWGHGMICDLYTSSKTYGVLFCYARDSAYTEREAVYTALRECERMVLDDLDHLKDSDVDGAETKRPGARSFLKKVQHYIDMYDPDQLTLFEEYNES